MDNMISRAEHDEFVKRMDEANRRQDKRLEALEKTVEQIHALALSVKELAVSIQNMVVEQKKQGERLEALESRDGELWRKIVGYALTAGAGFILAALLRLAGIV